MGLEFLQKNICEQGEAGGIFWQFWVEQSKLQGALKMSKAALQGIFPDRCSVKGRRVR